MTKDAFTTRSRDPEPPAKAYKERPKPVQPSEPVYYSGARFFTDPSGKLLVEIKADAHNIVGPKPATDEDRKTFRSAWDAYQASKQPEPVQPLAPPEEPPA